MKIIAKRKHLKMEPGGEYNVTSVEARALIALGIARKAPLASVVVSRNVKPASVAKAPDAPKRAYTRRDMVAESAPEVSNRDALFSTPVKDVKKA